MPRIMSSTREVSSTAAQEIESYHRQYVLAQVETIYGT
jgi:hypothetical protein